MTKKDVYVENRILKILLETGIPVNTQGYKFLKSAITLAVEDSDILDSVTKKLYPKIAEIDTASCYVVERSIRHAIDVAISRKGVSGINNSMELNVYEKDYKPSNSEVIGLISEKIRNEIHDLFPENDDK